MPHLLRRPVVQGALVVWLLWLLLMATGDRWHLLPENLVMSLTMVGGSFIAGSTSEGGGAVAFPVMTLALSVPPAVARDFSLMIQSVGMGAAALTIARTGVPIERRVLVPGSLGGAVGVVLGLELVSGRLSPAGTKMFFVSLWLSFGVALLWMYRMQAREVVPRIKSRGIKDPLVLFAFGVVGGIGTGLVGSGLDIVLFSLLTLAHRLDERVATPTSVVLMAINAMVGFAWRLGSSGPPIPEEAWGYWWACIPVVVVGAPLGARFAARRSRRFLVGLLLTSIVVQFVGALFIVPLDSDLLLVSLLTFTVGLGLFGSMGWQGMRSAPPAAASAPAGPGHDGARPDPVEEHELER